MAEMYQITGQTLTTEISDVSTGFVPVWQVKYRVTKGPSRGTTGYVNVPASEFNAETVKAAIDAIVYHNDKVASI